MPQWFQRRLFKIDNVLSLSSSFKEGCGPSFEEKFFTTKRLLVKGIQVGLMMDHVLRYHSNRINALSTFNIRTTRPVSIKLYTNYQTVKSIRMCSNFSIKHLNTKGKKKASKPGHEDKIILSLSIFSDFLVQVNMILT